MDKELIEHRAFMYLTTHGDNHGECFACDWIGPERDGAVKVAYDCAEHEQEFEDDED